MITVVFVLVENSGFFLLHLCLFMYSRCVFNFFGILLPNKFTKFTCSITKLHNFKEKQNELLYNQITWYCFHFQWNSHDNHWLSIQSKKLRCTLFSIQNFNRKIYSSMKNYATITLVWNLSNFRLVTFARFQSNSQKNDQLNRATGELNWNQ